MSLEDYIKDLDPELREKAKSCKTGEELAALAAENGIELTEEQLDGLAGGGEWRCKSHEICGPPFDS